MPRKPGDPKAPWVATRSNIVFLRITEKWSWEKIIRKTGCSRRTGLRWVKEWKEGQKLDNSKPGPQKRTVGTTVITRLVKKYMKGKKGRSLRGCQAHLKRIFGTPNGSWR